MMCERLDLKHNQFFRPFSHMLPFMLDSFMVKIFIEFGNELFWKKCKNNKVDSHGWRYRSILEPKIEIHTEAMIM